MSAGREEKEKPRGGMSGGLMLQLEWHNVEDAAAIRGGASLVHGVQMRKIAEKISM